VRRKAGAHGKPVPTILEVSLRTHRLVFHTVSICFLLSVCGAPRQARGQITEQLLLSFTGPGGTDPGQTPYGTLIVDSGNLYGTTLQGGGSSNAGVVFELVAATGAENVLHTFTGNPTGDGDGGFPSAGLVKDAEGNLYGTTLCGGDGVCNPNGIGGDGIIYEVTKPPTRNYIVLYRFGGGAASDGSRPFAPLLYLNGYLYGTTTHGGLAGNCTDANGSGCGTVFGFNVATGIETILYRFTGGNDGAIPYAPLAHDKHGHFDGTTFSGGQFGFGTIFSLKETTETVLHQFTGGNDGGEPMAGLSVDSADNLYGTTTCGGLPGAPCPGGGGVVYEFPAAGAFQTLHAFTGTPDGADPIAGVILDAAENLCGTTFAGGTTSPSLGTVFTLTKSSSYQTEISYDFLGAPGDGASPVAGLTFGKTSKINQTCPGTSGPLPPHGKGTCSYTCGAVKTGGNVGFGAIFEAQ